MNLEHEDPRRDPELVRLFSLDRLPEVPDGLRLRISSIPARLPHERALPRFQPAPLLAVASFLLAAVLVFGGYGGFETLQAWMRDLPVDEALRLARDNRELLPAPTRSGFWLAVLCGGTLLSLGLVAGTAQEGARLRRD